MKRFTFVLTAILLLFAFCAHAESDVVTLDDVLFREAKDALLLFEAGDFEGAGSLLKFADSEELQKFVTGNFTTLGNEPVQTTVSVAWWTGNSWQVAVPLHEPVSPDVEVLVLMTNDIDCAAFCGYRYADWGYVEEALAACDYVIWNEEYVETESMIIYTDD